MESEKLNRTLKEVIKEARELNIPVPNNIKEKVRINGRPKKRFGCCRRENLMYEIELSRFVLDCTEKIVRSVIAHEVLHTCRGCYEHGKLWKEYASKMNDAYGYNIKRVSSYEEMGLSKMNTNIEAKYIIKCEKCGREYPRQRFTCVMKKINAYRCTCGGKLTLITPDKNKIAK